MTATTNVANSSSPDQGLLATHNVVCSSGEGEQTTTARPETVPSTHTPPAGQLDEGGGVAVFLPAKDGHDGLRDAPAAPAPPPSLTFTVYGLDLSLTATGMSDGQGTWLVRSTGHRGDTLASRQHRLNRLAGSIVEQIDGMAEFVVIEGPSLGQSRQVGMHDRSGLWWLVVDRLIADGHEVVEVPPAALKKYATGKGNANKGAVIDATARRFPTVETGADDNRCDALWLAAMGLDHLTGRGVVPAAQRVGLMKVAWPAPRAATS